jgi:hypothetical protein
MAEDPFLWLEDIQGAEALDWVKTHNEPTVARLSGERFEKLRADALDAFFADNRSSPERASTSAPRISGDLRSGWRLAGRGRHRRLDVGGPFEQFAFVEDRTRADQGDQVRGVDGAPTGLRGVDVLVGHGQTSPA